MRLRIRAGRAFLIRRETAVELNPVHAAVWQALDGRRDGAEVVAKVVSCINKEPAEIMLAVSIFLSDMDSLDMVTMFENDEAAAFELALRWMEEAPLPRDIGRWKDAAGANLHLAFDRFYQVVGEAIARSSNPSAGEQLCADLGRMNRFAPEVADELLRREAKLESWTVDFEREYLKIRFARAIYEGFYHHRH